MPLLRIATNRTIAAEAREDILKEASRTVAEMLGKPERYVMVELNSGVPMSFGGGTGPLAYLELKSIGLPEADTAEFSARLCQTVSALLEVPQERIYIEFSNAARHLWGWNGSTF